MEADAIRAEEDAQQGYENFSKDTNDAVDEMVRSIITKTEFKAQCESDKVETEQSRDAATDTLGELADENAALHADCDYTLKNFGLRQSARGQEIEALKQAKMILSGASFSALLQGNVATPQMQVNDAVQRHYDDYKKRLEDARLKMEAMQKQQEEMQLNARAEALSRKEQEVQKYQTELVDEQRKIWKVLRSRKFQASASVPASPVPAAVRSPGISK